VADNSDLWGRVCRDGQRGGGWRPVTADASRTAEDRITDLFTLGTCVKVALAQWPEWCLCAQCGKGIADLHKAPGHPTLYWGKVCPDCAEGGERE